MAKKTTTTRVHNLANLRELGLRERDWAGRLGVGVGTTLVACAPEVVGFVTLVGREIAAVPASRSTPAARRSAITASRSTSVK